MIDIGSHTWSKACQSMPPFGFRYIVPFSSSLWTKRNNLLINDNKGVILRMKIPYIQVRKNSHTFLELREIFRCPPHSKNFARWDWSGPSRTLSPRNRIATAVSQRSQISLENKTKGENTHQHNYVSILLKIYLKTFQGNFGSCFILENVKSS
jgi:hypothetical protein